MIEVKNLTVSIEDKRVLKDVNLHIKQGETIILFGPNGSGKTSLLKTIIGIPGYRIESGRILFNNIDITELAMDKRAKLGIGIAFQRPPAVRGVKLRDILRICIEKRGAFNEEYLNELAKKLNLLNFLDRDINLGFSGGRSNALSFSSCWHRIPVL